MPKVTKNNLIKRYKKQTENMVEGLENAKLLKNPKLSKTVKSEMLDKIRNHMEKLYLLACKGDLNINPYLAIIAPVSHIKVRDNNINLMLNPYGTCTEQLKHQTARIYQDENKMNKMISKGRQFIKDETEKVETLGIAAYVQEGTEELAEYMSQFLSSANTLVSVASEIAGTPSSVEDFMTKSMAFTAQCLFAAVTGLDLNAPNSKNTRRKVGLKKTKKRKIHVGKRGGLYVIKYKKNPLTGQNTAYKSYLKQ